MRFNDGKPQLNYILTAPHAVKGLSQVFEFGAKKYARNNWQKGLKITEVMDSLLRHLMAYQNGEEVDSDSGLKHVHHITWNALILAEMAETRKDMDDRGIPIATVGETIEEATMLYHALKQEVECPQQRLLSL